MTDGTTRILCMLLTLIMLACSAPGVTAMFAKYSDSQLVAQSELIVVARYAEGTRVSGREVGILRIEKVVKGPKHLDMVFLRLAQPGQPISSSDTVFTIGTRGLWFLRRISSGGEPVYAADHPQRFVDMSQAKSALAQIQQYLPAE